jgi:ADP-ribosylglycohydrolase
LARVYCGSPVDDRFAAVQAWAMRIAVLVCAHAVGLLFAFAGDIWAQPVEFVEFTADELEDKIRGGMLGQVLGNLNGLPHEFKYIDEPGNVESYTPSLPKGAFTDDDTDIEWVYLREIARSREVLLSPDRRAALWKRHINRRIWCANLYARGLMDLGIEPPWTGNVALNPWSEFNISGQFVCESFGLMAPAMPQTAARIGLNYTHVTIDGEPAQTTQLFTTMIAMAFVENDIERLLGAGLKAADPNSQVAKVVVETRKICAANSDDWRAARRQIKQRWTAHGGATRDRNGYELNTASTVAALIYGRRNLVETLRIAFNFGWDCDNNAATAATIVGVMKGRRWMNEQGWQIADVYRNTTRDNMPMDETLTGFEDTLIEAAKLAIQRQGGEIVTKDCRRVYRIHTELPANVEPLSTEEDQLAAARQHFLPDLQDGLSERPPANAAAAYLAICLGEAERLRRSQPDQWAKALAALQSYNIVLRNLFAAHGHAAERLKDAAKAAGLKPPAKE